MTAWLFDLGNTRLKCAPRLHDGGVGPIAAVDHDGATLPSGWMDRVLPPRVDIAIVASVAASALRTQLLDDLSGRCGRLSLATSQRHCGGLRIGYAEPARLGVDRFLALLAAHVRAIAAGRHPTLVVGIGTALTVDLLDADGHHLGGRIAPSPALMREALHARVAHLPDSGGSVVDFAKDTRDALASGCDGAALGLVEHSLRAATTRLQGVAPSLLLHGGGAPNLQARLEGATLAPALVLEGLACWANDAAGDDRTGPTP